MTDRPKLKIRIASDIHNEFFSTSDFDLPIMPNEDDTVLVLAGDIGVAKSKQTYVTLIQKMSERFRDVILIMGNHEHYKGSFLTTHSTMISNLSHLTNVHVLEKDYITIEGVSFICASLWTDMDKDSPLTMQNAEQTMNDYKQIRNGTSNYPYVRTLSPTDTIKDHKIAKKYIFDQIPKQKANGNKVVVVSHHLPSHLSISNRFKTSTTNGAYTSELFDDIFDTQPDLWIHGHTHDSVRYTINNTQVVANPFGYYAIEENPDFNPMLIVEV